MSIKLSDGTILRNLEEQVLANKEEIEKHWNVDRVLADFGIKVLGKFNTVEALDDPTLVDKSTLEYGDGYLIGYEVPYDVYVWTRANINAGEPDDYFLNIGKISIIGPRGPDGPKGEPGERGMMGSRWFAGESTPNDANNYNIEDKYLNTSNGVVWTVAPRPDGSKYWTTVGNITGPQGPQGIQGIQGEVGPVGPQGPQGPQGDAGGFINIWGILSNINQAPTPASLNNLTVAYLVGASAPYDLWVQVGESSATAVWTNTGAFNAATAVSVGGVYQNIWDADTKLDKDTSTTTYNQAYIKRPDGTQGMINVSVSVVDDSIVKRLSGGIIACGTPTQGYHATTKAYVDDGFVAKQTGTTSQPQVYVKNRDGTQTLVDIANNATINGAIVQRAGFDVIVPDDPAYETGAVNKKYVTNNFAPKNPPSSGTLRTWTSNGNSGFWSMIQSNEASASAGNIPIYAQNDTWGQTERTGHLLTATPTQPYQAANKYYVDMVAPKPIAGETSDGHYRVHLTIPGNFGTAGEYFNEYGFIDPTTSIPCTITDLSNYNTGPGVVWFNTGEDTFQFTGWVISQTATNYSVVNGTLAIDFY